MKIIAAIVLLTTATTATADNCKLYGKLADAIMHGRQIGVPVSTALAPQGVKATREVEELVFAAYDQPRYQTSEYQRKARENFQNATELACYKQMRGNK
jgi:hypothetical protein